MSNVFVIDFETNGLNPYYNDVIELAVKSHNSDTSYQTLIKPIIDPSVERWNTLFSNRENYRTNRNNKQDVN